MRRIDADAFENYVFDEWSQNEISNGDWIQFREWLNDQKTVIEFEGDINKVIVKGEEYHRIVRCKDCENRDYCTWNGCEDDDYCSYGRRKDEDN
jgi:hypothetical protein